MKKFALILTIVLAIITFAKAQQTQIGINLYFTDYWNEGENAFKDQMKQSGEFMGFYDGNWNNEVIDSIPRDTNGYPNAGIPYSKDLGGSIGLKDLYVRKMISANGRVEQTDFVFLYDGNGTINLQGDITITNSTTGRIEFICNGNDNIYLEITQSDISPNHLRNFRIVKLADESSYETNPWKQSFIDRLQPFYSIRFMDWFNTNSCPVWQWNQRTSISYNCQNEKSGVAYEYAINLANTTQKHVWICVPHMATPDYINQMAVLFRDNLNPDLDIYLEYSNEVWNWMFDQNAWVQDDFTYLDPSFPHNDLYDNTQNVYYNTGKLAKRTFQIWRQVFADDSLRVKRVLACQGGNVWVAEQMINATGNYFDYISPDWYFGASEQTNFSAQVNAQEVIDSCRIDFYENRWEDNLAHYTLAQQQGKKVIAYEGGQHTTADGDETFFGLQAFYDAQTSSAMYELYDDIIDTLKYRGAEMLMAYTLGGGNTIYGSWGHISNVNLSPTMENAPKYMALLDNMPTTSIINIEKNTDIKIYPNPTSGILNLEASERPLSISIIDITGKTVFKKSNLGENYIFDISNLKTGIYLMKVQTKNCIFTTKIIKK